ncbi:MAG: hypothetical protein R3175_08905 [Marinobacter sp.]|nr:hypothetical protein [Marinobacter sp.]MDX1756162.1 hypothetical protein [Marinobacter sp.]
MPVEEVQAAIGRLQGGVGEQQVFQGLAPLDLVRGQQVAPVFLQQVKDHRHALTQHQVVADQGGHRPHGVQGPIVADGIAMDQRHILRQFPQHHMDRQRTGAGKNIESVHGALLGL